VPDGAWLNGVARNTKVPYERLEMLVSADGRVSRLNVISRDESKLEFTLTREIVNLPVNDQIFAFQIPPGAEVVDAVAYSDGDR
jgi:hypothetical protein